MNRSSRSARSPSALAALLCLAASCASRPALVRSPPRARSAVDAEVTTAEVEALAREVEALRGRSAEARQAAEAWTIPLASAHGALQVSGEAADDDRIADASVVARVGASAAVLVRSSCGNAWLVGLRDVDGRWRAASREGLVSDARPGGCRVTRARASACAMADREAREVVATFDSESEEGSEVRDPVLRVYRLARDGTLTAWSGDIPFGDTDDATGAVREGQWVVDDALMLPRDLYVQIQPGRPGPGGVAPPVLLRRTYRITGRRMTLVEESAEAWRPRGASTSPDAAEE